MSTYQFCVRSIFLQAMLFVAAGLILGIAWKDWRAVSPVSSSCWPVRWRAMRSRTGYTAAGTARHHIGPP
jgi:hypothetical protein